MPLALHWTNLVLNIVTPLIMAYFVVQMGRRANTFKVAMQLERAMFLRTMALIEGIPIIENESTTELFTRILQIRAARAQHEAPHPPPGESA